MREKDGPQPVSNLDLGEPRPLGGGGGPAEDARSSVTLADEGQPSFAQAGHKHLDGQAGAYGYRPHDEGHGRDLNRQSSADEYHDAPATQF